MVERRFPVVRPARGEIWSAEVPYDEGSYGEGEQRAKDRPCLVVSGFTRHAYVLKITSKPRDGHDDHIGLPAGWHPWDGRPSWVRLWPLAKVPHHHFRQRITDCPAWLWARVEPLYPADATPASAVPTTAARPRAPRPGPTRPRATGEPRRAARRIDTPARPRRRP